MQEEEGQHSNGQSKFTPLSTALSICLRFKQLLRLLLALCYFVLVHEVYFMLAGNCVFICHTGTLCSAGQF